MLRQSTFYAALVIVFAMRGPSVAQTIEFPNDVKLPPASEMLQQTVRASGFRLKVLDPAQFPPGAIRLNIAVLDEIIGWLSINFDLRSVRKNYPNITFLPPAKMRALRFREAASTATSGIVFKTQRGPLGARELVAAYDDKLQTIYLPEGWTGATAVEISVLIHEMVHHVQSLGHLKYDCLPARHQIAYAAQDKWLGLFGLKLVDEFKMDDFTLAVSTKCIS